MNEQIMNRQASKMGEYQESKALSEIKGKMVLARQFPRDVDYSMQCVLRECARPELASVAQYEYPKGDSVVRGPSIRLVEVLARNWENLSYGANEIETDGDSTTVKAFAWDLQTNVSDEKVFTVRHVRSTRNGTYKLKDERDIYEMVANKAARRKRACILAVLPGWYVDAAVKACEDTLKNAMTSQKSVEEVRANMVTSFEEFGVTPEQIENKMGMPVDKLTMQNLISLSKLHSAIKDGFVKAADAFGTANGNASELPSQEEESALDELNARFMRGSYDAADEG